MVKKKKTNSSKKERNFGVILEDIDSKLDLVVEGHGALDKKIDAVANNLDDFKNETSFNFKVVHEILDSHTKILSSHTKKLDSHTQMIVQNTENIEIIKADIEFIKNAFKKKVDLEEFENLEKRVLLLERKISRGRA